MANSNGNQTNDIFMSHVIHLYVCCGILSSNAKPNDNGDDDDDDDDEDDDDVSMK